MTDVVPVVAEIRAALVFLKNAHHLDRAAIRCKIETHAPEWLGALVQRVEDQQQELAGLRADGQRLGQCLKDLLDAVDYDVGVVATGDAVIHARAALASPRNE